MFHSRIPTQTVAAELAQAIEAQTGFTASLIDTRANDAASFEMTRYFFKLSGKLTHAQMDALGFDNPEGKTVCDISVPHDDCVSVLVTERVAECA